MYRFEDDDGPPAKKASSGSSTIEGLSSNVSVHIIHQINNSNHQEPKISTNVTVNQTIQSQQRGEPDKDSKNKVECKTEPKEDSANKASAISNNNSGNNSNSNGANTAELDNELADILNTFDKDDAIPQDIIDELNKFDEIYKSVQDSEGNETFLNNSSSSASDSGNMFASNMYVDPAQGPGPVRAPGFRGPAVHPTSQSSMSEGGLAAETLKQMAAQHQQHHTTDQYRVKSAIDPFSDLSETNQFGSRNGYTPDFYSGMSRSGSAGPYNTTPPGGMGYQSKPGIPPYPGAGSMNNKLTHYAHNVSTSESSGPSSLQQLQNQVAHFNQPPQMEITQTQHMQVSDGSHRMQMSQTQHVQLRQPLQNISLTQQQGFSAAANMMPNTSQSQNFMGSDQMTLQQQQMMQSKLHQDQRQSHMQQYMNRPPPEYNMQHSNGMASAAMSNSGMGPNPLQTIQNMVNQTNTHPNAGYSSVKSESNDMQNGMRSAQMTAMQQQIGSSVMSMPQQAQLNYNSIQSVQRQSSYPGDMSHQAMNGRSHRPNAPTYTSAIMRNQRPPNVNIGPDGLNISQPRHTQDWPRPMNPMAGQTVRTGGPPVTSNNMMHFRSYSTDCHPSASGAQMQQMHGQSAQRSVQMDSMQAQQQVMMQGNAHAQQMVMQQQRMHMSQQQMGGGNSQSGHYGMGPQGSGYPQSSSSQDDILNLLDSAPNQSTDFFDVNTSSGGTDANWYDIEDILGTQK